jgi:hypothetical protein
MANKGCGDEAPEEERSLAESFDLEASGFDGDV